MKINKQAVWTIIVSKLFATVNLCITKKLKKLEMDD